MLMNKKIRKVISTVALLLVVSNLAGCSQKHTPVKPDKDPTKIVEDKDITKDLNEEEAIEGSKVYLKDDTAIGTMIIKEGVSQEDAKALAEKYAKEIKETYKDMKVNVQAVQNGENLANITLE
ncbi:hypothetical protein SH2C18_22130 [Clostridium sediminicola]|uniref:hypothetical protein n=1 Tax=Clostridium sediminicola TaxID=3114879 RepID=UPI0031F264F2